MLTKRMKTTVGSALLGVSLLSPVGAFAGDNFTFLEEAQQKGAYVRPLSADEDRALEGENWQLVVRLMILDVKIYGRLGWEIGRMTAIRQYGIDPGPYPGLWQALTGRFESLVTEGSRRSPLHFARSRDDVASFSLMCRTRSPVDWLRWASQWPEHSQRAIRLPPGRATAF